ncbi:MAG: 4-hydroxy-tetrahydrodipicolinate reductase [Deltaproteobacteria bacterium]|nr:4-hydroxy-tetrahydrodipicolinate reductase [Deltaproteobacteria bacterium]
MLKVLVAGAGTELAGAFERPDHESVNEDVGVVAGIGELGVTIAPGLDQVIEKCDVLIDFTTPEATLANLRTAVQKGLAMVIGTTGISGEALDEAEQLARKIRCVMAPNMSVGVNVMFKIAEEMAEILGDEYDMEILEVHHRFKKDAPSGTAMKLARILAEATGRDLEKAGVYERKGFIGERTKDEIGIQTWRAGDIAGEHTILFGGIGERLELIHRAHSRDNFARGAVRAALWVAEQPVGLYDMQDVLGLKD